MSRQKVGRAAKAARFIESIAALCQDLKKRTGCIGLSIDLLADETKITQTYPNGQYATLTIVPAPPNQAVNIEQLLLTLTGQPHQAAGSDAGSYSSGLNSRAKQEAPDSLPSGDETGSVMREEPETLSGVLSAWDDSKKTLHLLTHDNQKVEVRCPNLPQLGSLVGAISGLRCRRLQRGGSSRTLVYAATQSDLTASIAAHRDAKS